MYELHTVPRSNQVSHLPDETEYSGKAGPVVMVRYARTLLGGFQHTLSECYVWLPMGVPRANFHSVGTRGKPPYGEHQYDVCSDNLKKILSRVPSDCTCSLCHLIAYPKITHFHGLEALPLDPIICNTDGCGIVTNGCGVVAMDVCFWLRVPIFFPV
jgi:hypothetical protein